MTIGTKTAEIRSANRCTSALPPWASVDQAGDLGELGVGADAGRADLEPSADVDCCADDGVAGTDLDRQGLTRQHGSVHRRAAGDHDAVGGDFSPGRATNTSPTAVRSIGIRVSAVRRQHDDVLCAHVEQCPQCSTRLPLGAGLEVAAGKDEGSDGRGHFQVDVRAAVAGRARLNVIFMPGAPARPKNSAHSDQR